MNKERILFIITPFLIFVIYIGGLLRRYEPIEN